MSLVDLLPALREHNGTTLPKSGNRLIADLRTARAGVERLIAIAADKLPPEDAEQAEIVQTTLRYILSEIDSIDPSHPPAREALELLSHRVKLVVCVMKLLFQKQIASKLAHELVERSPTHQE